MKRDGKRKIGFYQVILIYQVLFLLIVLIIANLGIIIILRKDIIGHSGEDLAKRNTLLQLTLKDSFHPDLPPPEKGPAGEAAPPDLSEFQNNKMVIEDLETRIQRACSLTGTRFTVISAEGVVSFDSNFAVDEMENQKDMPEIAALLGGEESGLSVREDSHTSTKDVFQALPLLGPEGELLGFTRVSQPFLLVKQLHNRIIESVRISNLISFLFISLIILPLLNHLVSLIKRLEEGALEISQGNFDNDLPSSRIREFASLISAMEYMAGKLKEQIAIIEEQSLIDELTGLGNRRMFNQKLEYSWWLCVREDHPLSLLIMDIDKFKQYNDSLGHPEGDECLKKISALLQRAVNRHTDVLVRLGGEEFGILLPEEDSDKALMLGEKILAMINEAAIPHPDSPVAPHVTISIGIASLYPLISDDMNTLFSRADEALYRAKEGGRNRIAR